MSKKKELEKVLDLVPQEVEQTEITQHNEFEVIDDLIFNDDFNKDFEAARTNIYDLIDTGNDLLQNITSLAKTSDQSRPYEVAADLFAKMIQAQKELIDIHKRKQEISESEHGQRNKSTINIEGNAIFTGSTTELQKLLEKDNNKKD